MTKNNDHNKKRKGLYIIGSVALAVIAFIVMPKIIEFLSKKMYRLVPSSKIEDNDDWGPEIVRKEKATEDKPNGEF